ncbi:MAG: phosphoenolpyruvate--protein phosphotransferase [Lachnospiraceae bacterium]|nr:phosphoenolpyruvate--protein phosphotransferase [Lachnospiraceae bacterium]
MQQYNGKGIADGVAAGPILYYDRGRQPVIPAAVEDTGAELKRYEAAKTEAHKQLQTLCDKALKKAGKESAAIFEVHRMMLDDEDYNASVTNRITGEKVCAEYAVAATGDEIAGKLSAMDDDYLRARSADVEEISGLMIRILSGTSAMTEPPEPVILVAEDLSPSETVQFDRSKLLAFVTRDCSANSHTAILARTMNLPAVTGIDIDSSWNGKQAVVDGCNGTVTIDPDEGLMNEMLLLRHRDEEHMQLLQQFKGRPTVSRSGRKIRLCANIGSVTDTRAALENDAEGIGLFRSEFLYLESNGLPTEELLFNCYKTVAKDMAGKQVVIRTLDLGSDKQAAYLDPGHEANPAMGWRGIRICLDRPDIFRTQLRAIYRASSFGDLAVMFPMIVSLDEVRKCKGIMADVKAELKKEGLPFKEDMETGIMIETPAAAVISESLAKEVDFFSIGTNDLTQYTLAIDRQNAKLESIYDSHHPAVLELIRMTIENGHKAGVRVGICGELAADTSLTQTFLDYGVDELSVSPSFILTVRSAVINAD